MSGAQYELVDLRTLPGFAEIVKHPEPWATLLPIYRFFGQTPITQAEHSGVTQWWMTLKILARKTSTLEEKIYPILDGIRDVYLATWNGVLRVHPAILHSLAKYIEIPFPQKEISELLAEMRMDATMSIVEGEKYTAASEKIQELSKSDDFTPLEKIQIKAIQDYLTMQANYHM
jgi:hypothetical protein